MARTILLADDSVTAQNMGRRILVDAGYEVITVNNGSSALKKITEEKPDLIVLDVYMPGYGGLEVCQRIREAPETARIPVLLTVGKLEPFKADEARRVRADAFIVKPFEASELLTALTNLEDKIVAQPTGAQRGQQMRTEAPAEPTKDFGDKDRGWRSRLRIPSVRGKSRDADSASSTSEEYYEVKLRGAESAPKPTEGSAVVAPNQALKAETQDVQGSQATTEVEQRPSTPVPGEARNTVADLAVPSAKPETEAQPLVPSAPAAAGDAVAPGARKSVEDEVAAVLATIPDNANGGATAAALQPTGPRWIAESVAPTTDESSLLLEQEMERATASTAVAVDAARSILSHYGVPPAPTESSIPQETKLPTQPEKPASPEEVVVKTQEAPVATAPSEPASGTAAPLPETSDQKAQEVQAQAVPTAAGASAESPATSNQTAPASQPSVPAEPPAVVVESKENSAAAVEHLLAASVTTELASELVAAAESTVSQATEAGTNAQGNGDAITSIVDKVLAELKPKLIEEIAKKMKKDNP